MILKKLGQNFLIDKGIAKREIQFCDIKKNDVVLEIGPGKGVLTDLLSESASKVIAVEIDKELVNSLRKNLPENVLLIHSDVLKLDFNTLPKFNKIVSNLPYQISSPITFKLLDYKFSKAVLIYQKEFADRMVAKVGSKKYSRLSVGIYYKSKCKIVEIVPRKSFYPQPKVDSCMVTLIPRESYPFYVSDQKIFYEITNELFKYRRKKIKNILKKKYSMDLNNIPYKEKRVEELTPEQLGKLSNIIHENQYE